MTASDEQECARIAPQSQERQLGVGTSAPSIDSSCVVTTLHRMQSDNSARGSSMVAAGSVKHSSNEDQNAIRRVADVLQSQIFARYQPRVMTKILASVLLLIVVIVSASTSSSCAYGFPRISKPIHSLVRPEIISFGTNSSSSNSIVIIPNPDGRISTGIYPVDRHGFIRLKNDGSLFVTSAPGNSISSEEVRFFSPDFTNDSVNATGFFNSSTPATSTAILAPAPWPSSQSPIITKTTGEFHLPVDISVPISVCEPIFGNGVGASNVWSQLDSRFLLNSLVLFLVLSFGFIFHIRVF